MLNVFEQPWTLVGVAVVVLFGIFTFRSVFPEKRHWWQFLVPILVVALAFGLDGIVQTDLEKIDAVIAKGVRAVKDEDVRVIGSILSDRYSDSYHSTKQQLLDHFKRVLSEPLVANHKETGRLVDIKGREATVVLFTTLTFEKNSHVAQNYVSFLMTKSKLYLQKSPDPSGDDKWLIRRIEVLELNRQPANWGYIR